MRCARLWPSPHQLAALSAEAVAQRASMPLLNLTGMTSPAALGAVIARLAMLATNDTGPSHLAYALGTPVITIWGGGDLERYRPPEKHNIRVLASPAPCRPCWSERCPNGYLCLNLVTVEQVIEAAESVICPGLS